MPLTGYIGSIISHGESAVHYITLQLTDLPEVATRVWRFVEAVTLRSRSHHCNKQAEGAKSLLEPCRTTHMVRNHILY